MRAVSLPAQISHHQRQGQTKTETRNAVGELIAVVDELGNSVSYSYDATGNLKSSTQHALDTGVNAVTTLVHDQLGRKTALTDADMGTWTYSYNAFGELILQTTGISGKSTTVAYDLLGRMTGRIDFSGGAQESSAVWTYDLGGILAHALGKVVQEDNTIGVTPGVTRAFTYDGFGRSSSVTTTISGSSYSASNTYDQFGRTFQAFDGAETNSGLEYQYTADGHLEAALESRGSASVTLERYRITAKDQRGQVTGLSKGGIDVTRSFAPDTGRVQSIYAQTLLTTPIQDLDFTFDALGNLTGKTDVRRSLTETYDYDGLNRLTDVSGSSSLTMAYDGLGNITSKSDVGSYLYAGPRPHAVTTAGGVGYLYDGNGNLTSGDGRSNSYTVFNKPYLMSQAGNSVSIDYGPNRERYRRIEIKGGNTTSTHYVGAFEKIWRPNGINETKRYLDGEVIVTTRSNGTQDTEYLFTDHLGSTDVITDNAGSIVQSMGFDAFGKRRDPVNYAAYSQTTIANFDTTHTTNGFTGHEGLDPVGLVHMNGRVYEPRLGRFTSADPFVQDPTNTQSLNRYSYVFNTPLSGTDPSGHVGWVAAAVWAAVSYAAGEAARTYHAPWLAAVGQIAGCAWGFCIASSMTGTYGVTHDVNAALKSGAIAGASQVAFGQIHEAFGDVNPAAPAAARTAGSLIEQGIAHGVVGGVLAELQGGKFGNGFVSAGLGFALGAAGAFRGWNDATNIVVSAIVGGTTSEITGGQFANGAATSAFGYLFNEMADKQQRQATFDEAKKQLADARLLPDRKYTFVNEFAVAQLDDKEYVIDGSIETFETKGEAIHFMVEHPSYKPISGVTTVGSKQSTIYAGAMNEGMMMTTGKHPGPRYIDSVTNTKHVLLHEDVHGQGYESQFKAEHESWSKLGYY